MAGLNVYIDAEWDSSGNTISMQVLIEDRRGSSHTFLIVDYNYQYLLAKNGYRRGYNETVDATILFIRFRPEYDLLTFLVQRFCQDQGLPAFRTEVRANLYLFYSIKDLWISMGWDQFEKVVSKSSKKDFYGIDQKRNIVGRFATKRHPEFMVCYKIRDLCGWTNQGLAKLASSVGVEIETKKSFDQYKSTMELGIRQAPHDFIKYALNDVHILKKIVLGQVDLINQVCRDYLNMDLSYNQDTIPMTQGRLVSDIFMNYIGELLSDSSSERFPTIKDKKALFQLACMKLSILDTSKKSYEKNHSKFLEISKKLLSEPLEACLEASRDLLDGKPYLFEYDAISQASIPFFLDYHFTTTGIYNALVSGGRTVNERPWEFLIQNSADIDLASCYGSALRDFTYPIGLPVVYATTPNQEKMTLGEFLKHYQGRMEPNLYTITVSGKLSFPQDLIFSKITSEASIKRSYELGDKKFGMLESEDNAHLAGDFVLIRQEILNGVITADLLEVLRNVCSNTEYKEFMDLQVVTATYWDSRYKVDEIDEWVEKVLQAEGDLSYDEKIQSIRDTRTRSWFPLKLEAFIGKLVVARLEIKQKSKSCGDPEERKRLDALQNALKLIINVFYGCTASPYFPMNNTVLANNITARARVEVWKLSKALNTVQSITDGGNYSPERVFKLNQNGRRPSLSVLSDLRKLEAHRSISVVPLAGRDWGPVYDQYEKDGDLSPFRALDGYAKDHVTAFWAPYGLTLQIGVEHKLEATALRTAFMAKAHPACERSEWQWGPSDSV